jgi:hypothetical protein
VSDFFTEVPSDDIFLGPSRVIKEELLTKLRRAPLADHDDLEVAVPLARLVHEDLEKYGTGGGNDMDDDQMREALQALRATVLRLGLNDFDVPFRDFSTFYSYWIGNGAKGSYQARRDLLAPIFEPLHDQLADMEQAALTSSLAKPVSPHARTGWPGVDAEISELRRHFLSARTPQDYRNIGNDGVAVLEALSRTVYDPALHLREGETEPPVDKTKQRLERFVECSAPGPDLEKIRRLARATIDLAHDVKHSETPTRREAGIAADAVIQLANMLRRLDEEQ